MAKKWTKEELEFIKDNFDKFTYKELGSILNRNVDSLKKKANDNGLFKTKDLETGKKYNYLTIIRKIDEVGSSGCYFYLCKCDCGNECKVNRGNITGGWVKSCGCGRTRSNSKTPGTASYNHFFAHTKRSAEQRGRDFALTKEQYIDFTSKNCHYCGEPPVSKNLYLKIDGTFQKGTHRKFLKKQTIENAWVLMGSIDRINSDLGYTVDNCVPSCWPCNEMKSDRSTDIFLSHIC
jgi:hypothetical protein